MTDFRQGPLGGIRVVEFAGAGPGPMAGMLLADLGAEVLRIDRLTPSAVGISRPVRYDLVLRGKRSIAVDLKHPDGIALVRDLLTKADVLIEGFRPGTMEKIGLGPDVCLATNPRLVYGRVTGYGQEGPMAMTAGHDLNYIGMVGVLDAIGRAGAPPTPPLNLVGDYGGGALYLAFGLVCALLERGRSGSGQVVDAAMIDGAAGQMIAQQGMRAAGMHDGPRGTNILDSGAPFYDVYLCADGEYLAVAPIEGKFRSTMLKLLSFGEDFPDMNDRENWPAARTLLAERFKQQARDHWCALFAGTDGCVSPVLSLAAAPGHPHHAARRTYVTIDGVVQPAPAPRFSRSSPDLPSPPMPTSSGDDVLHEWRIPLERLARLRDGGVIL